MSQFASPLEAATYVSGVTDLDQLSPEWVAQATILLEMISADVEADGGVPIDAGSGVLVLAGAWSRDLELPAGPIRNVSAVTVNGIAQDAASYWWNERSLIRRGSSPLTDDDDSDWPRTPQGAQDRDGVYWSSPASTVLVALEWGFEEIPDFVKSLVLRIFARTIGNVGNVTQESLAVYSVTYGKSTNDQGSHLTDAERRRLRRLLNRRGGTIAAAAL